MRFVWAVGVFAMCTTGAFSQDFQLMEIYDADIRREVVANIKSIGQPCPQLENVWAVVQNGKRQPAFKARCVDQHEYQLTIFNQKIYVKPWTGMLLVD